MTRRPRQPHNPAPPPAPAKVHLISLGCSKNQVDSENMLGALVQAGAAVCESPDDADVIVINTCGFITSAKEESIGTALEAALLKESRPGRRLVVVGCLVERHGAELRAEMPEVDAWVGLGDIEGVVRACGLSPSGGARLRYGLPHVGYLKVSEGCDNRCSYCAIPLIRGGLRSRSPEDIVAEARWLVADGAREIVVIGQDTTSYGKDRPGTPPLASLLESIAEVSGDAWLRLMYAHPAHFTDDLIGAFASVPNLCPYVDLPLQHLADPVLKGMGRGVDQAQSLRLIEKLRERIPGLALRTTFLVGFPGETQADFEELLRLVEEIEFDHLGAFTYSKEPDTPAADMPDQVPEEAMQERWEALMEAQQDISERKNAARVGEEVEVLVDGPHPDEPGATSTRTKGQAPEVDGITIIKGEPAPKGEIVRVQIIGADAYDLFAKVAPRS